MDAKEFFDDWTSKRPKLNSKFLDVDIEVIAFAESYASQQMPSEDKIKKFAKGLKNTLDYVYHNGTSQEQKRVKRYIISQTMQLLSLQQEKKVVSLKEANEITKGSNPVYGECAKHKGESMLNCNKCAMESLQQENQTED